MSIQTVKEIEKEEKNFMDTYLEVNIYIHRN